MDVWIKFFPVFVFLLQAVSVQCSRQRQTECSDLSFYDSCICLENRPNFKHVVCVNLLCTRLFTSYLQTAQMYDVRRLSIKNMGVKYIPAVMFEGNFTWLDVSTSDFKEKLFESIPENNKIEHLMLNEVKMADLKWDWEMISPLKKLTTLRMRKMPLGGLQNFSHLAKSLKHIVLFGCDVRKLQDDQFQEFKQLELIDIRYDRLKELKRSMFPTPSKLRIMIFQNNHLSSLPEDLFEGMRDLEVIDFQQNRLVAVSYYTIKPVLNPVIYLQGNPLKCDCNFSWIFHREIVKGKCDAPDHLKGKEMKEISGDKFLC